MMAPAKTKNGIAGPAIRALQDIGVAVKVLTGDNAVVTSKICREVGLENKAC